MFINLDSYIMDDTILKFIKSINNLLLLIKFTV